MLTNIYMIKPLFVELTVPGTKTGVMQTQDRRVSVNMNRVQVMGHEPNGTLLCLGGDNTFRVLETPEQIDQLINNKLTRGFCG